MKYVFLLKIFQRKTERDTVIVSLTWNVYHQQREEIPGHRKNEIEIASSRLMQDAPYSHKDYLTNIVLRLKVLNNHSRNQSPIDKSRIEIRGD